MNNNENTNTKKPFYKQWWFYLIIGVVLLSLVFGSNDDETGKENTPQETTTIIETNNSDTTTSTETEDKLTFELIAGEQGEYGKMITYNKGTEFEESFYAFYVPTGTYTVTNIGEYMTQVNVYSDEIVVNDAGWEEVAEAYFVEVLDVNASTTVTVEKGQHIEITEPTHLKFIEQ